ncbi:hypothetical protein GCM10010187_32780 [Actinomadura coerulea]|nr:hypothetical protein GCM10010187_32780 [Actinomadura coerulea]
MHTRDRGLGRCYRDLVAGLTRIGGDRAAQIMPRLKQLFEALWDCEADVRERAAAHVQLADPTRAHACTTCATTPWKRPRSAPPPHSASALTR